MAKKKAKPLKLSQTFKLRRGFGEFADYDFSSLGGKQMAAAWPVDEVKEIFGRVICPPGKTATVKITIEVEAIE